MSKTIQATKKKVGQINDRATSTLGILDEKPYKANEAGSLNPKWYELHFDLTLTLIPNQSYAKMHKLCIRYAYAYSYYAYPGIFIHECLDVHAGTSNSHPDMDEHQLLHDHFMPDMYKDEFLKETKFQIWLYAYPSTIRVHIQNFRYIWATLVDTSVVRVSVNSHIYTACKSFKLTCPNFLHLHEASVNICHIHLHSPV